MTRRPFPGEARPGEDGVAKLEDVAGQDILEVGDWITPDVLARGVAEREGFRSRVAEGIDRQRDADSISDRLPQMRAGEIGDPGVERRQRLTRFARQRLGGQNASQGETGHDQRARLPEWGGHHGCTRNGKFAVAAPPEPSAT